VNIRENLTVVVGVDAKTLIQFEQSHRTWRLHHPWLFQIPWVVFFDGEVENLKTAIHERRQFPEGTTFVSWPHCAYKLDGETLRKPKYESQREKMLSGHVYVPAMFVETDWHLKLDTDCVAQGPSPNWPDPEWFRQDDFDRFPAWVAPKWFYTKGINALGRLEDWGDRVQALAQKPRLNIPFDPKAMRVGHPRMCSWCSFYRTSFTKRLVNWLSETMPPGQLPIPSQDGVAWYAAARAGEYTRIANQKSHLWTNVPKLGNLIALVQRVMRGEPVDA